MSDALPAPDFSSLEVAGVGFGVVELPEGVEELIEAARSGSPDRPEAERRLTDAMSEARWVWANDTGIKMLGAPDMGFVCSFFNRWWFKSGSYASLARADATRALLGTPTTREYALVNLASLNREYLVETSAFQATDGKLRLLLTVTDLTDRRRTLRARQAYEQQLALALEERGATLRGTRETATAATELIVAMVGRRDSYTAAHMRSVAELSVEIAAKLGADDAELEALHTAGLIHDVGKLSIPAELLSKSAALTPAEMGLMRDHVRLGVELLGKVGFPEAVTEVVAQHHERCDGSGYPEGITGEHICHGARIHAVADVATSMAQHRPYRAAATAKQILDEIALGRGTLYDAEIASAALRVLSARLKD